MNDNKVNISWTIAYWMLFIFWVIGALLEMYHIHGGFLTNYLADLSFPPWFYINIRGLWTNKKSIPYLVLFGKWFGQTPERALVSIFTIGLLTELKTLYWPHGFIGGTYDTLDILAYAVGLLVCFHFDKRSCILDKNI